MHPRYYPYTLPDYRHTDKHLRLVMTLISLFFTRSPNIDCCAPEIWPWPLTLTLTFYLKARQQWCQNMIFDIWPWSLTYDLDLQSQSRSTSIPKINVVGQTVQTGSNRQTNKWTEGMTLPSALSPCFAKSTRLIIISKRIYEFIMSH